MNPETVLLKQLTRLLIVYRKFKLYRSIQLPLKNLNEWRQLPFVGREEMRNFSYADCPEQPFSVSATSGSSASRLFVYHSRKCYLAHVMRQIDIYSSAGLKRADVCLNLCSYSISGGARIMDAAFKEIGLTVIPYGEVRTKEQLDEVLGIIRKVRPNVINSYVNQSFEIFSKLRRGHGVDKCIINGEVLPDKLKDDLRKISGTAIHNNYGSMEFSGFAIAQSPEDGYMKVFPRGLFIEVVDKNGKPAACGRGSIVVTDLCNNSMPFLRYALGDEVELIREGKNLFIKVFGRSDDHILIHGEIESMRYIEEIALDVLGHPFFFFVMTKQKPSFKDKIIKFSKSNKRVSKTPKICNPESGSPENGIFTNQRSNGPRQRGSKNPGLGL